MSATDLERLVVQLSADLKGYQNSLRAWTHNDLIQMRVATSFMAARKFRASLS